MFQEPIISPQQQVVIISDPQPERVNNGTGPSFVMKVFIVSFAVVASALGLAEIVIGANIYAFLSNSNFGAWWAGTAAVISALFGLLSVITANMFFSTLSGIVAIFAFLVVFVGALVDGIEWNIVDHNRSCYSPYSNSYYGQTTYFEQAFNCYDTLQYSSPGYCYCVEANNNLCFHYDISQYNLYNCGDVLGYYTRQLQLSTTFCSILVPVCLFFIIISSTFMCMICCRRHVPDNNGLASAEANNSPIIYMADVQPSGSPEYATTVVASAPPALIYADKA